MDMTLPKNSRNTKGTVLGPCTIRIVVHRAAYAPEEEYGKETYPGQLLFATERLLPIGSSLTGTLITWRGSSHL